jgi:hypothetical protein
LNLPARDPVALARWYESRLGLRRRGAFVFAPGTLLVFEPGEPLGPRGNTHFGFEVASCEEVAEWARRFEAPLEAEPGFASTKVRDPEGNCFEIYWEPDGPHFE